MKLGPSLIGAIVGALVGVAAQIGLESSLGREATWFALVVGLLTGLGARLMAGGGIAKASFVRAGLAALIALAAIFGGSYASSELTRKQNVEEYQATPAPTANPEVAATAAVPVQSETGEGEEGETAEGEGGEAEPAEPATPPADDATEPATNAEGEEEEATTLATEESPEAGEATETPAAPTTTAPIMDPARRAIGTTPSKLPPQPLNVWQLICVTVGVLTAYELSRGGSRHS